MTVDSIESRLTVTPEDCERVYAILRANAPDGVTARGIWERIGTERLTRVRVLDALEQMQARGAVRSCGTTRVLWFSVAVPARPVRHDANLFT
jgi:hypothetical protein